jgi:hypothetical protein
MIEVHRKMSIRRVKANAGVATEKGLGAEGQFGRKIVPGIAENIRYVVAEMRSAIQIP